ncbi:catechol 1,2-dioxygenase [Muricauda sp. 334s03]|uniref:catechol 1,2-dioxygenase n=1 Tax=Flagellimonas yonaguniensis TaxID=3031325 RepID=A0ABT5Y222_9FLAO|nr:catechol 1,2-dioxygenase [[Muricauda] yonaguniensis]MDF0717496.1 catechol 1,2-dioxygenase [[Muricauda] yonaguniensis]
MNKEAIDAVLEEILSKEKPGEGNERIKEISNRLLKDLFHAIAELDITAEEVWKACDWITEVGKKNEIGLVAAGTGLEHFLDEKMDWEDAQAGIELKTPRTIEGPLYVAGSPESLSYAELENEPNQGDESLYMQGEVLDEEGNPIEGALVEVWHCNKLGLYSYFDSSQSDYNLRRAIRTAADGKYQFKSFLPVGYSCPPEGPTDRLMKALGRHGSRPAHIHFFITAPGYRKLTTQINIEGDPLTYDDFAFATKKDLVPPVKHLSLEEAKALGKDEAFASIDFNFHMVKENEAIAPGENNRTRASITA